VPAETKTATLTVARVVAAISQGDGCMLDCNAPIPKQQEDISTLDNSFKLAIHQVIQSLVASGKLSSRGEPDKVYLYHSATGTAVGAILRWNICNPDGSKDKIIQPIAWDEKDNTWKHRGMPTPRPLYALPKIVATHRKRFLS
jgi:hypothetical protein